MERIQARCAAISSGPGWVVTDADDLIGGLR
jgi:hypothetical protein